MSLPNGIRGDGGIESVKNGSGNMEGAGWGWPSLGEGRIYFDKPPQLLSRFERRCAMLFDGFPLRGHGFWMHRHFDRPGVGKPFLQFSMTLFPAITPMFPSVPSFSRGKFWKKSTYLRELLKDRTPYDLFAVAFDTQVAELFGVH